MLACPNCQAHLQRNPTQHGIFFDCPDCGGRNVGIGVLRKLLDSKTLDRLWLETKETPKTGEKRCPHCLKHMKQVWVRCSPESTIELDVCPVCTQVWFDPKEFTSVQASLPKAEEAPQPELSQEAKIAIAEYQVAKLEKAAERELDISDTPFQDPLHYLAAALGLPIEAGVPAVQRLPLATWGLLALCVMAFLLSASIWTAGFPEWSFIPAEWSRHVGATFVSSFFLHAGIWHLVSNMYFLLIFGDNVEDQLGKTKFLLLILAATVGGNALHMMIYPGSMVPCVGASGGIAGILAYYALAFPHAKVCITICSWRALLVSGHPWINIPAPVALLIFLGIQLFGAYADKDGGKTGGIGWWAHIGGLATGGIWFLAQQLSQKLGTDTEYRQDK